MPLPLATAEARRLSADQSDWNLPGGTGFAASRTRGGGHGKPNLQRRTIVIGVSEGAEDDCTTTATSEALETEEDSIEEETPTAVTTPKKPPHTRVILEVAQLQEAFRAFPCPLCQEHLELKLRTVCIATNIELLCNNKECSYVCDLARPTQTTIHEDETGMTGSYERMTDFAVNVLYVLGFISMGDGHTEAGRLLGLLGLPNDTTMMNRSFGIIEERIGPFIRQLCDEIIKDNLEAEAKLSMNEFDYNIWMRWKDDDSLGPMPVERMPHIDASYDMAWQQKGSGHVYNSQSGHGSLFGRYSRKIIGLVIKSKLCSCCKSWSMKNPGMEDAVRQHRCWRNHDGSSGSMESSGAVSVIVEAFEKNKIVIKRLCCDDDSSIRADCQWSNADYLINNKTNTLPMIPKSKGKNMGEPQVRADKGKLPGHVPEPEFVADPNHRRKGLHGELIKLDLAKVSEKMTMTRMDSTRIAKNFGYMARTLKNRPEAEFVKAATACLEHHFDCHANCDTWCKRKDQTEEQKQASVKYYRCKEKDAKLYALLHDKVSRFVTIDRLKEMAHSLDTNMNEAFNQICTWFAPKNKVFAGTGSLSNRIALAVGINSLGVEIFFQRLFKAMGVPITPNVAYYLQLKEKNRVKRLAKLKTKDAKLKKNKRKYDKLAEDTLIAKKELHKRMGTYRRGMNLDEPEDPVAPAAKRTKTPTGPAAKFCVYCGRKDHLTRRSKKCTAQSSNVKRFNRMDGSLVSTNSTDPATIELQQQIETATLAREDCERMDSLPFDAEYDSEQDLPVPFFDEDGDSDDESVGIMRATI
jgi:hypothetical protein